MQFKLKSLMDLISKKEWEKTISEVGKMSNGKTEPYTNRHFYSQQ